MNYYMIQKSLQDFGPVAIKFITINKDKIIRIFPYGVCAGLLGYSVYKSNEQKEKDLLYQKQIQKSDAVIKDLEKKAERVEHLESLNEVLVDTLTQYKQTRPVEA